MPYSPTNWQDGVTLGNQTRMNNMETQYTEAANSFEQDLFTAFIYSGLTCTKDGSIANQLDIALGVAFLRQSDNTLRRRAVSSITKTTSTASTTYYLYVQPDGSLYWSTTNSPASNSLAICQVTTDVSGNISTVQDTRTLITTLLSGMVGTINLPVIVAQGLDVHVTATTIQTIVAYSVPATGLYRVSGWLYFHNGTAPQNVSLLCGYTEPHGSAGITAYFLSGEDPSRAFNAKSVTTSPTTTAWVPLTVWAKAGTFLSVFYIDAGGTPNDYVTAVVERLA